MAYHIYGPFYCKDMAISVCDMQSKDTKVQCILWKKLNTFVERKGLGMIAFKGSMENNAQANQNVVRIIYGIGDPTVKMVDKK